MVSCRERVGRASSHLGVPAPFVYPLASLFPLSLALARRRCCHFCGRVFSLCCLAGGYAPPIGIAPAFFDSLCARYAQRCIICSRRGGSCARLTVRYCHVGRVVVCGVAPRAWACGPSGVPLGRERGAQVSHLCSFSRMLRRPSVARCIKGATGSPMGVIERVKRYGITG